jgi:SOS-response transcriptional repressor LexA
MKTNRNLDKLIALNIKHLMDAAPNLRSQPKLAAKSGVGQTTIGRILRAEVSPTTESLAGIADAFNISVQQLMNPELTVAEGDIRESKPVDQLPLFDWDWIGGSDSSAPPLETIECPFEASADAFVVAVKGQSMAPKYNEGTYLCVDPVIEPLDGDDVIIITTDNHVLFRQYQDSLEGKFLIALNPDWPNRVIEKPKGASLAGVIVGWWNTRKLPL